MRERGRAWLDMTITSPPYNIGIKYADGVKDDYSEVDYRNWSQRWMTRLLASTKPDGHFFLNVGAIPKRPMRPFDLLTDAFRAGWVLQNTFHWVKSISVPGKESGTWISRGQFKPINSPRFVTDCHEYVFHLTPNGDSPLDRLVVGVPFQDKTNLTRGSRGRNGDKRCRGNMWFVPYRTIRSASLQRPHPATFPVELAEMAIKIAGSPVIVMDPFVGSGSSALAAKLNNRHEHGEFIGIDKSPTYIESTKLLLQS